MGVFTPTVDDATACSALPQFMTEIDGIDMHFIHVWSPHANALIITHGWPGSVVELLNAAGPLSDPTAHGGNAEDPFRVVIPSMRTSRRSPSSGGPQAPPTRISI